MTVIRKKSAFRFQLAAIITTLIFSTIACGQTNSTASDKPQIAAEADAESKALHDKLAKYLTGTRWTGNFTMTGEKGMNEETYEIISAAKGETGDYWNLIARIKYGGKDVTLPLPPIEIKFAGKTPVITVDNASFPGFGIFDARVVIRQGKYAGTWSHSGGVGGHLFGKIEKMDPADLEKKKEKARVDPEKQDLFRGNH